MTHTIDALRAARSILRSKADELDAEIARLSTPVSAPLPVPATPTQPATYTGMGPLWVQIQATLDARPGELFSTPDLAELMGITTRQIRNAISDRPGAMVPYRLPNPNATGTFWGCPATIAALAADAKADPTHAARVWNDLQAERIQRRYAAPAA